MNDTKRAIIAACVFLPLAVLGAVFLGLWAAFVAVITGCLCVIITHFGWHRVLYDEKSKKQRVIYAAVMLGAVLFSLFTCAVRTGRLFWLLSDISGFYFCCYLFFPSWVRAIMKLMVVIEILAREIQKEPLLK